MSAGRNNGQRLWSTLINGIGNNDSRIHVTLTRDRDGSIQHRVLLGARGSPFPRCKSAALGPQAQPPTPALGVPFAGREGSTALIRLSIRQEQPEPAIEIARLFAVGRFPEGARFPQPDARQVPNGVASTPREVPPARYGAAKASRATVRKYNAAWTRLIGIGLGKPARMLPQHNVQTRTSGDRRRSLRGRRSLRRVLCEGARRERQHTDSDDWEAHGCPLASLSLFICQGGNGQG